jgi:hypothetical protein
MHRLLPPEIERIVKLDFDVRFETNPYLLFQEFDRFRPENLIGLGPELQHADPCVFTRPLKTPL